MLNRGVAVRPMKHVNAENTADHMGGISLQMRVLRLVMCLSAIILLWGIVLPQLSEQQAVRERIERDLEYGIDPSAMFYTEVGIDPMEMDDYRRRFEARREADDEFPGTR